MLTRQNALRHLNVEHTLPGHEPAVGIDLRDAQGELPGAAVQGGIDIEQHSRMMVLAASGMKAAPVLRACAGLRAEKRLEEVAVCRIRGASAAELKTRAPVRRRPEILTRGV